MHKLAYIVLSVALCACANKPPAPIDRIPAGNLSLAEAQTDTRRFAGSEVRWGGSIIKVENKASNTLIEIVERPLEKNGKPRIDRTSAGRFIARFVGFVDPVVYENGRLLTIIGRIDSELSRPIGEFNYSFPLVTVSSSYLWPKEVRHEQRNVYPPWWYYDPWPYYYRPHLHHHYHD